MSKRQSWRHSIIEAKVNAVVGLIVSYLFSRYGLPIIFDIHTTSTQAIGITACYFFLSLIRSLILRRVFNGLG